MSIGYPWNEWPYTNVHEINLDWVIKKLQETIKKLEELETTVQNNSNAIQELQSQVKSIQELLDQLQSGGWDSLYQDAIEKWVNEHLPDLISSIVKFVFFGLSIDGHFVACIPTSWNWLNFDTILNTDSQLYGHLVLKW